MANIIVDKGLQVIGGRASATTDGFSAIQSMSLDNGSTGFVAGDDTIAASTNVFSAFDATPTRSSQTVSHKATFSTSEGNFTVRRLALHNIAAGSGSSNTTSLVGGVDGQVITKTSEFSLTVTLDITYQSA